MQLVSRSACNGVGLWDDSLAGTSRGTHSAWSPGRRWTQPLVVSKHCLSHAMSASWPRGRTREAYYRCGHINKQSSTTLSAAADQVEKAASDWEATRRCRVSFGLVANSRSHHKLRSSSSSKGKGRSCQLRPDRDHGFCRPVLVRSRNEQICLRKSGWPLFFALLSSLEGETEFT